MTARTLEAIRRSSGVELNGTARHRMAFRRRCILDSKAGFIDTAIRKDF
jgi:hypothetical protein